MQCEKKVIGTTEKTRSDLDAFLNTISHQFSMTTYDLINNNCNNFSDVVCRFLTGKISEICIIIVILFIFIDF